MTPPTPPSADQLARLREWIVEWHEKRDRALAETGHSTYRVFGLEGLLAHKTADLLALVDAQAAEIERLRGLLALPPTVSGQVVAVRAMPEMRLDDYVRCPCGCVEGYNADGSECGCCDATGAVHVDAAAAIARESDGDDDA